jgi:hypothetical protein
VIRERSINNVFNRSLPDLGVAIDISEEQFSAPQSRKRLWRIFVSPLAFPVSVLAQTRPPRLSNVRVTLCASVRGELVTLRIGRKR